MSQDQSSPSPERDGQPSRRTTSSTSVKEDGDDSDMKILNAKRMLAMRMKMASAKQEKEKKQQAEEGDKKKVQQQSKSRSDREVVLNSLTDRGDEVLSSAERNYPRQTASLIPGIARLIREGKVKTISGGELLHFLRSLGMRVSVSTSISVQEHGKFVSLADKLKRDSNS